MIKHSRAYLLSQEILCRLGTDAFPLNVFLAAKQACPLPVVFMTLSEYRGRIQIQDDLLVKDALCICRPGRGYLDPVATKSSPRKESAFPLRTNWDILCWVIWRTAAPKFPAAAWMTIRILPWRAGEHLRRQFSGPAHSDRRRCARHREDGPGSPCKYLYLSQQAIKEYRLEDYRNWKQQSPHALEQTLLARCRQSLYLYRCDNCGQTAADEYAFCPVCGQSAMQAKKSGGTSCHAISWN